MDPSNNVKSISSTARIWAILFAILLGITLMLLLLSTTLNQTLFNANFLKSILINQKAYEQLPQLIAESAKTNTGMAGDSANLVSIMTIDQLAKLIAMVLPENYIQTQVEKSLDSAYKFINLQSNTLDLSIDLQPIKDRLSGENGQQVIIQYINSLQPCTIEQIQALINWQKNHNLSSGVVLCKPSEPLLQSVLPRITDMIPQFVNSMPSKISLNNQTNGITRLTSSMPYRIYRILRSALNLLPWVGGILALLVILLTLRSGKTMFACLGIPLLASGVLGLGSSLLTILQERKLIASLHSTGNPFDPMMIGVIGAALHRFGIYGIIICSAAIILGGILLILSLVFEK